MVEPANPSRIVLRVKYNQTCFAVVLMHLFHKPVYTIVRISVSGCFHQGFIELISHPSCLLSSLIVTGIAFVVDIYI